MEAASNGGEKRVTLSLPSIIGYALQESEKGNDGYIDVFSTKYYMTCI